jgi:hypothetical protein
VEKNTTLRETAVDTMMLLPRAVQNGMVSITRAALARKLPPGNQIIPFWLIAAASWLPIRNDHQIGKAEPSRTAIRMP